MAAGPTRLKSERVIPEAFGSFKLTFGLAFAPRLEVHDGDAFTKAVELHLESDHSLGTYGAGLSHDLDPVACALAPTPRQYDRVPCRHPKP